MPSITRLFTNYGLELEKRKQEAQETFRKHSKTLTEPTSPTEPPFNKYTLRGVNTLPHVTYVLKRRVPEKGTRDSDGEGEKPDEWQWWRISFSKDDAKARLAEATQAAAVLSSQSDPAQEQPETTRKNQIPRNADVLGYTARKVREIEVLRAAREESRSVLLVYANEHAVNFQESGLPPELQVCHGSLRNPFLPGFILTCFNLSRNSSIRTTSHLTMSFKVLIRILQTTSHHPRTLGRLGMNLMTSAWTPPTTNRQSHIFPQT